MVRDIITGCSKRYAFVEYYYDEDFSSAFFGAHRMRLDDAQILVDFMREQTVPGWVPRRFGGGVGGKKPSGQMRFGGRDCPFRAPFDINIYRRRHGSGDGVKREEWREQRGGWREQRRGEREERGREREQRRGEREQRGGEREQRRGEREERGERRGRMEQNRHRK